MKRLFCDCKTDEDKAHLSIAAQVLETVKKEFSK